MPREEYYSGRDPRYDWEYDREQRRREEEQQERRRDWEERSSPYQSNQGYGSNFGQYAEGDRTRQERWERRGGFERRPERGESRRERSTQGDYRGSYGRGDRGRGGYESMSRGQEWSGRGERAGEPRRGRDQERRGAYEQQYGRSWEEDRWRPQQQGSGRGYEENGGWTQGYGQGYQAEQSDWRAEDQRSRRAPRPERQRREENRGYERSGRWDWNREERQRYEDWRGEDQHGRPQAERPIEQHGWEEPPYNQDSIDRENRQRNDWENQTRSQRRYNAPERGRARERAFHREEEWR